MHFNTLLNRKWTHALCAVAIATVIAVIYWPVAHAQFVYDDVLDFQKMAWLRHGSDWQQFLFRKFNDWVDYFRPLGVAVFTVEVRLFDAKPGPMHLVSLALHLLNTFLVGRLAVRISELKASQGVTLRTLAIPMLLYGLHPLLVEPVVWVGCQFELTATLFMLLGWIANIQIRRQALRAIVVAICFFLAACSKESSLAFPFIIVVFDWFLCEKPYRRNIFTQLSALLSRNWATYAGIIASGMIYLFLRHWSLGELVPNNGSHPLPIWARLQESSFLYLRYWRMFFWPSMGMAPMHPVSTDQFLAFNISTMLQDAVALSIVIAGAILALRRNYIGGLILCITFSLLPVLHIIASNFDQSPYHERYAMTALATACAWLPSALRQLSLPTQARRILPLAATGILVTWLMLAAMTIHVTAPLWSNQVKLWQWALQENPDYIGAKDELISAYIDAGSYSAAWALINDVVAKNERCMNCMLNAASLSIKQGDAQHASFFLQKIKDLPELYANTSSYRFYLTTVGQVELMDGHPKEAEAAARSAIALDKLDPQPLFVLADALATQGNIALAEQVHATAISLLMPDERPRQQQSFNDLLSSIRSHGATDR